MKQAAKPFNLKTEILVAKTFTASLVVTPAPGSLDKDKKVVAAFRKPLDRAGPAEPDWPITLHNPSRMEPLGFYERAAIPGGVSAGEADSGGGAVSYAKIGAVRELVENAAEPLAQTQEAHGFVFRLVDKTAGRTSGVLSLSKPRLVEVGAMITRRSACFVYDAGISPESLVRFSHRLFLDLRSVGFLSGMGTPGSAISRAMVDFTRGCYDGKRAKASASMPPRDITISAARTITAEAPDDDIGRLLAFWLSAHTCLRYCSPETCWIAQREGGEEWHTNFGRGPIQVGPFAVAFHDYHDCQ